VIVLTLQILYWVTIVLVVHNSSNWFVNLGSCGQQWSAEAILLESGSMSRQSSLTKLHHTQKGGAMIGPIFFCLSLCRIHKEGWGCDWPNFFVSDFAVQSSRSSSDHVTTFLHVGIVWCQISKQEHMAGD